MKKENRGKNEYTDYPKFGDEIFKLIKEEKARQIQKWGIQTNDVGTWLSVLGEEVGQCHRAFLENKIKHLRKELVQVATVAMNICEALEFEGPKKRGIR